MPSVPPAPVMPSGELTLQAPPAPERTESGGVLVSALAMLGSVGSVAMVALVGGHGGVRGFLAGGLCLLATVGFVIAQVEWQRRIRRLRSTEQRGHYLRYLAGVRAQARTYAEGQRAALLWHHPPPESLVGLAAEGSRVAERAPGHELFLQVRYGVGRRPLTLELVLPEDTGAGGRPDPVATAALERLVRVHREQPDLPRTVDLAACRHLTIAGEPEAVRAAARALLCSATAFHGPEHLRVAVLTTPALRAQWSWLMWLPHAQTPHHADAVGPRRLVVTSPDELTELCKDDAGAEHLLLVLDGTVLPLAHPLAADPAGTTVLALAGQRPALATVDIDGPGAVVLDVDGEGERLDRIDIVTAEAYARRLATWRDRAGGHGSTTVGRPRDLPGLLGLAELRTYDPVTAWRPRTGRERLRVPIGVDDTGAPVHLDLKEAAEEGMGPHGLLVGATGSGKSELLRTLVLALALSHPPEQLNLVLVDFKGGATFAGTAALPHVSAVITNLADDLGLVTRMQDALAGELVRRQELLRAAGDLASLAAYEQARRRRPSLPPLPSLLIVVDEFSELLAAQPELTDLFVAIGRVGRSLGIHLLLASQRLDEGRLRGLESPLSYRIGLRTFSAHESRAVLGSPDAYELPSVPGLGYLKAGPDAPGRFQAAYVSGPVPATRIAHTAGVPEILPFAVTTVQRDAARTVVREGPPPTAGCGSLLELAVARLASATSETAAHRIWLPPLTTPPTLDALLHADGTGDADRPSQAGRTGVTGEFPDRPVLPIGLVDRPREQRHDVLRLDLGGAGGHVAIVGAPRSGKSTLLATLASTLALGTSPEQSQLFLLDLGGALRPLAGLPHVSAIATRGEPEVVRRAVAELRGLLEHREAGRGERADRYGEVFLVVDGWAGLRAEFEELEPDLQQLAERGLAHGIHLVTATTRWADYRPTLRDLLGTRLELRLGDPADSVIDRRTAMLVPCERPGRGLTPEARHFLAALPRIDGQPDPATLTEGLEHLVQHVRTAWRGRSAPRLRLLPERVGLDELRATANAAASAAPGEPGNDVGTALLLGVRERDLAPVTLDPDTTPHLVVLGDGGSGRTTFLRSYAREVIRTRSARQAQLVVVDFRRSLLGEIPDAHLLHHLTTEEQASTALQELASYLRGRLPGADVTPAELRSRSWWHGAEVFVLVDDDDLVTTAHGSPLRALQPLLAQARDVGLHLVLARRAGGASRALHQPVIQTLLDLATPGLLLSADPAEGPLLGSVRAAWAPPGRAQLITRGRQPELLQLAWSASLPTSI